jgi:hypothetical protein
VRVLLRETFNYDNVSLLTGSRGAVQNHAARDSTTILCVCFGLLQKVDNFSKFQFGSIASSDFIKRDSSIRHHLDLSLALSKAHGVVGATNTTAGAAGIAAEEEETSKENGWKNETLRQLTESVGFLLWQHGHVNLGRRDNFIAKKTVSAWSQLLDAFFASIRFDLYS